MVQKIKYSVWIGLWKSVKNVAITVGVPAILVLINNYVNWMPEAWYPVAVPIMSIVSYFTKNYVENK